MRDSARPTLSVLVVLCVVGMASNSRSVASSVGPVLQEVRAEIGMNGFMAGLLTAMPGLCFGIFGIIAPWVSRRYGLHPTLTIAMAALTAGALLRTFAFDVWSFILLSALALAGIAFMNVLIPPFIRLHAPNHIPLLTAIYAVLLAGIAAIATAVASPIAQVIPGGWRGSLGMWGLAGFGAVVPLTILWIQRSRHAAAYASGELPEPDVRTSEVALEPDPATPAKYNWWTRPRAVALMVYFGLQCNNAYVQFGWLPQILRDAGMSPGKAGWMLALLQLLTIPGGFLAPVLMTRPRRPEFIPLVLGLLLIPGYGGLMLAPLAAPVLWILLLAVSGYSFPISLLLIGIRTSNVEATASLSGYVQGLGYIVSGIGPLVIGALHSAFGGWQVPLWTMIGLAPIMALGGFIGARKGYIDQ